MPLEKKQLPDSAPNVLLIMLDDVGFGSAATFGGPVEMPAVSEIAKTGYLITNFIPLLYAHPPELPCLQGVITTRFIWEESPR